MTLEQLATAGMAIVAGVLGWRLFGPLGSLLAFLTIFFVVPRVQRQFGHGFAFQVVVWIGLMLVASAVWAVLNIHDL